MIPAVAALAAAVSCAYAATQGRGRTRAAWLLLAAGAVVWSLGPATRLPSFLLAGAGVMAFPTAPAGVLNRVRLVFDGGIVAASVLFVWWAVSLNAQSTSRLVLADPAADFVLLTLLGAAMRRASGRLRLGFALLFGGFLAHLFADGALAYPTLSRGADLAWVVGYLLVALAAFAGRGGVEATVADPEPEVWQLALPWSAVFAVILTNFWATLTGRHFGPELGWIGGSLGVLFILSQALAAGDSVALLRRSRRAESLLRERTALMNEVIERAPLGIGRLSDELRFVDVNPRLAELLATPSRALLGASIYQFLPEEEMVRVMARTERMRKGELDRVEVDSEMRRGDGTAIWVHRTVTPVFKPAGGINYYLVMFEDTTAKHEMEQAALANLTGLERLSRLKSEFMSMVSHEFRTALTGIQGYSELMSSEEVAPPEVKEFAGDINADALRLNRMITEMLDLDRIESGRMAMHMRSSDVNQILCDAVDRARMTTDKHNIVTHLAPNLPMVEADTDRLTQVVANLLSNAVKYSPDGGDIEVASCVQAGNVEVSVKDHGQGIPREFATRIFGRYERYEGAGKTAVVGTGLGLAIAQQIIELHKGRIWVDSAPGEGSNFRFTIPVPGT